MSQTQLRILIFADIGGDAGSKNTQNKMDNRAWNKKHSKGWTGIMGNKLTITSPFWREFQCQSGDISVLCWYDKNKQRKLLEEEILLEFLKKTNPANISLFLGNGPHFPHTCTLTPIHSLLPPDPKGQSPQWMMKKLRSLSPAAQEDISWCQSSCLASQQGYRVGALLEDTSVFSL